MGQFSISPIINRVTTIIIVIIWEPSLIVRRNATVHTILTLKINERLCPRTAHSCAVLCVHCLANRNASIACSVLCDVFTINAWMMCAFVARCAIVCSCTMFILKIKPWSEWIAIAEVLINHLLFILLFMDKLISLANFDLQHFPALIFELAIRDSSELKVRNVCYYLTSYIEKSFIISHKLANLLAQSQDRFCFFMNVTFLYNIADVTKGTVSVTSWI